MRRFPLFLVPLLCALLTAPGARAEEAAFPVERFRPALDGRGILDVEGAGVGSHLELAGGFWLDYALNPLVLTRDGDRAQALVAHRFGGNLVGAISLFDWVQLGVDLPVVLFQARDAAALKDQVLNARDLSLIAVGDLRVVPKVRLLRQADHGVDLALAPSFTVPTAFPFDSYAGEGQLTFVPELLVGRELGPVRLGANLGYRLRLDERRAANLTVGQELIYRAGAALRLHELLELPVEVAASVNGGTYALAPFTSGLEENPLEALVGFSYEPAPALQLFAGLGMGLLSGYGTPDLRVFTGLRFAPRDLDADDDGVPDANDGCPAAPEDEDGFSDADGCPDADNDADGVPDAQDACPDEAEDVDGFSDADGCPDPDNDADGVLDAGDACPTEAGPAERQGCPVRDRDGDRIEDEADRCADVAGLPEHAGCPPPDKDNDGILDDEDACPAQAGGPAFQGCPDTDKDGFPDPKDACPTEPETINGVKDDDGCPDKGKSKVSVTRERIEILDKVYFDTGRARIQRRSHDLLDQVASVLRANPQLTRVRVEGHTDARGNDRLNQRLSQARADAVKGYLVERGIDAARLEAVGYGESRPVASNKTRAGREQNRRVAFSIVEVDGRPVAATDAPHAADTPAPAPKK